MTTKIYTKRKWVKPDYVIENSRTTRIPFSELTTDEVLLMTNVCEYTYENKTSNYATFEFESGSKVDSWIPQSLYKKILKLGSKQAWVISRGKKMLKDGRRYYDTIVTKVEDNNSSCEASDGSDGEPYESRVDLLIKDLENKNTVHL